LALNRLVPYFIKNSLRDVGEIFYYLIFPLLLSIMMIFLFGKVHTTPVKIGVYGVEVPVEIKQVLDIEIYSREDRLISDMRGGILDIALTPTKVYALEEYKEMAVGLYRSITATGGKTVLPIKLQPVSPSKYDIDVIEFYLSGMLVLALINSSVFAILKGLYFLKNERIADKLQVAGVEPYITMFSYMSLPLVYGLINLGVYMVLSIVIYGAHFHYSIWLIPITLLLLWSGIGFGGIVAYIVGTDNALFTVSAMLQLFMFFSGIYFPVSFLPSFLRYIAYISPLYYAVAVMRYFMLGSPLSAGALYLYIFLLFSMGAVGTWLLKKMA